MGYSTSVIKIFRDRSAPAAPTQDPDWPLVQRIAAQDESALQILYQKHAPGLLQYLVGRTGDVRLAEEVLQDVMLAAWRSADHFRGECRVRTWLLTIAHRRAINAYHRQLVPTRLDTSLQAFEQDLPAPAHPLGQYDELHAAMQTLPSDQRETLELVFFHGLSLDEAARVLGVAEGTVKSRLHRAKTRLREVITSERELP